MGFGETNLVFLGQSSFRMDQLDGLAVGLVFAGPIMCFGGRSLVLEGPIVTRLGGNKKRIFVLYFILC